MNDGKIKNEFPWGKQWPPPNGSGNYAAATGRRRGATMPVGSFKPNSIGLYERVPNEYLDPTLTNIANIINESRITAVHAKERIPIPSRDQAVMVIFATRDVVRRNLSHQRSPNHFS